MLIQPKDELLFTHWMLVWLLQWMCWLLVVFVNSPDPPGLPGCQSNTLTLLGVKQSTDLQWAHMSWKINYGKSIFLAAWWHPPGFGMLECRGGTCWESWGSNGSPDRNLSNTIPEQPGPGPVLYSLDLGPCGWNITTHVALGNKTTVVCLLFPRVFRFEGKVCG